MNRMGVCMCVYGCLYFYLKNWYLQIKIESILSCEEYEECILHEYTGFSYWLKNV